ncbi:MAG: phycobilisome rod-core linker polypeptide [Thainema sp.]
MTIPVLEYKPATQNQRVDSFGTVDTHGDVPVVYRLDDAKHVDEVDALIRAAYRQVFNEQEMLHFNRQIALETQLRNRAISVRDFIRGLAKSERFYELVVAPNNNYRLVEICCKRLLGREPYGRDEEIAWSIQIASLGWAAFVDWLLDSEEYIRTFGKDTVPYQRKRFAERPFSFTPRYGADYRDRMPKPDPRRLQSLNRAGFEPFGQFEPYDWQTILQRTNGSRLAAVLVSVVGIITGLLVLASVTGSLGG